MRWAVLFVLAAFVQHSAGFGVGSGLVLRSRVMTRSTDRAASVQMQGRKDFDKKYDKAFDEFRTSGSMPNIPSVSEQYSNAAAYVREKGVNVGGDEGFGQRVTEAQLELQRMQDAGMKDYEELKKELVADTLLLGSMALSISLAFFDDKISLSYGLGMLGSIAYSFLLTRTADRLGEQGGRSTLFDPGTPARFGILLVLIIACAKNKEALNILPVLFGFFVPYKLASLRPAFVSPPTLGQYQIRLFRRFGESEADPPFKVEYGYGVSGRTTPSSVLTTSGTSDVKTQGSSAPLGKRKILSIDEQYEALKKGTLD